VPGVNDREWIQTTLQRYEAPLVLYAARICGLEPARDAVQDTFLELPQAGHAGVGWSGLARQRPQLQRLRTAFLRWSMSTLASGSTTSCVGSNAERSVSVLDSPAPSVVCVRASR
jgi:hypothetical protein